MGFEKFHIFAQNPWVLANGFTENCQFGAKTDRNSVFLGHDTHIVNRLSITVPYFIFYGFWKISHFCSKSMGVSLRVYRKLPVWGKNWPNLRISWSWPPYYKLVIYNGPVIHFLWVLKSFPFLSEIHGCWPTGLPKIASLGQKLTETPYFLVMAPVLQIGYL
jgi:hypothetical protein